jgi:hypothetical protein
LLSSGEPSLLLSDNSVENGEELSGDGDDCDQLWFTGVEEALMEAPERGIVAGGDQSAHEEGARTCVLPPPMKLLPFHCSD